MRKTERQRSVCVREYGVYVSVREGRVCERETERQNGESVRNSR